MHEAGHNLNGFDVDSLGLGPWSRWHTCVWRVATRSATVVGQRVPHRESRPRIGNVQRVILEVGISDECRRCQLQPIEPLVLHRLSMPSTEY